ARAAARVLDWWAARRRRSLERAWRRPGGVQEERLLGLVTAARDTEFGLAHGFAGIRSVSEYQERVPLRDYLGFQSLWERAGWGGRGGCDVARRGAPLGEDVRDHRRRQADPGNTGGARRPPPRRLGRPAPCGGAGGGGGGARRGQ